MQPSGSEPVTELLLRWRSGEQSCLDQLISLIEDELRQIVHRHMRAERHSHTLQTTALVNEVYLKLMKGDQPKWQNRAHFFGVAAQVMRHILVDHARGLCSEKRGGGTQHLPLNAALVFSPGKSAALVALDEALTGLANFDARKARVVELRYFGGMSVGTIAEALGVHPNTVRRDWTLAKIWLKRELTTGRAD
jgi:RNA polymerase sigma-70 factor, ECF subfamily